MKKLTKRILILMLTFIIGFNTISSNYKVNNVKAEAATATFVLVLIACAASLGIVLTADAAEKIAPDFQKWLQDNSADNSKWGRIISGGLNTLAVTALMIRDVREYFLTHGIDSKTGSVAEKTVTLASSDFTWFNNDKFSLGYPSIGSGSICYLNSWNFYNLSPSHYTVAFARINANITGYSIYFITDARLDSGQHSSGKRSLTGYTLPDASKYFYDNYIVNASGGTGTASDISSGKNVSFTAGKYYVWQYYMNLDNIESREFLCNVDVSKIAYFEFEEDLKSALGGDVSSVDLTIPSIGTYDDTNITDLTDGRTLSAADLQAIADALANPYADYKNGDGTITQEDLQNAVTAAIAAALAAAGGKEEPDTPIVPDIDISGILDFLDKIYKAITTFFVTATSFVTTFPLQRWKEFLETFPSITQQITDAIGDVFLTDKSILETLTTFPTAESLKDLITGVPADLADLKDAVTIFPKAFQDAMTDVVTDVFPAALIDALTDALPKSIISGVASLPLSIVDLLIPQLELTLPKALELSLPKILTDALSGSITIPDIKVDFPAIEIPNYMDILSQILAAILSIPALLTLDVPLIKAAVNAATKDVALETGVEPILALFQSIDFGDDYTYPVISITTPDILKPYYPEPEIILCDFEDYAEYCLWARNIFRVTLWLAFLYWASKQLQVKYHIA